jgi:HK97 gp10 family phage protein
MPVELNIEVKNATEIIKWLAEKPEQTVKEIGRAIEKAVYKVQEKAKRNSPVDTGRMRASITKHTTSRNLHGEVVVGVNYGIYVHEGTRHMRGRPFLKDAVGQSERDIESYLVEAINNVIKS